MSHGRCGKEPVGAAGRGSGCRDGCVSISTKKTTMGDNADYDSYLQVSQRRCLMVARERRQHFWLDSHAREIEIHTSACASVGGSGPPSVDGQLGKGSDAS